MEFRVRFYPCYFVVCLYSKFPANIYQLKVAIETLEKGVKYVQS